VTSAEVFRRVQAIYERDRPRRRRANNHCERTYGLSREQFHGLMAAQNGACAICQATFQEPRLNGTVLDLETRACVDHCHATLRVRGLLCPTCNFGLGHFRDDPVWLRRAAAYLERAQQVSVTHV
jgi:hypothetical protein